jgi:hypothetical protein
MRKPTNLQDEDLSAAGKVWKDSLDPQRKAPNGTLLPRLAIADFSKPDKAASVVVNSSRHCEDVPHAYTATGSPCDLLVKHKIMQLPTRRELYR